MDFYYLFSIFGILFIFDTLISFYTLNNNLVRWYLLIGLYTMTPMLELLSDPI